MAEPYTIRILVPDGDPEGIKIVELLNWTGVGIAFPRMTLPSMIGRSLFKKRPPQQNLWVNFGSGRSPSV
jgi:hypothetical protein